MLDFRCFSSTFSGGYKRICYPSLKNISQKVFFCRYLSSTPSLNPLITGKDVLTSELFNNKKMVSRCLMSTQGDLRVPGDLFCVSSKAKLNNIKFFSSHGSEPPHKSKQLTKSIKNPYEGLTLGEKVKEASKDVTYTGVIIVGIGITAIMFYAIGRELLSQESPNAIFGNAFKRCKNDEEVQNVLGEHIKAYGEESGRRRRRHVNHVEYDVGGVKHMRMKFYIEGQHRKATVNLEMKQNESGKYEYRYLFVQMDSYPHQIIVLEDNR
ncbi:TIM21 [Acanthosepion pharaonis]|uniref:Mitochondrial import inner membrane translocase subunit Tim21 n=1 Tax=Acanthosepion pharaonis TaxID=158019 RepID=A0A812C713_ACAPH|nr:TIM21 [Sepia pharaonis]